VECKQEVHDRYNERVDAAHENMVWTHPGMNVYYRNSRGRVVVNSPFPVVEFWRKTRHADLADYDVEPRSVASRRRDVSAGSAGS
jgi:4-hydroxyacetophenone monooxygenase